MYRPMPSPLNTNREGLFIKVQGPWLAYDAKGGLKSPPLVFDANDPVDVPQLARKLAHILGPEAFKKLLEVMAAIPEEDLGKSPDRQEKPRAMDAAPRPKTGMAGFIGRFPGAEKIGGVA